MLKFVSFFSISTLAEENVIEKQVYCNSGQLNPCKMNKGTGICNLGVCVARSCFRKKGAICQAGKGNGKCYGGSCYAECKPEFTALKGGQRCMCGTPPEIGFPPLCTSGAVRCDSASNKCTKA